MSHSRSNSKSRPVASKDTRPTVSKETRAKPGIPTSTVNTLNKSKPKPGVAASNIKTTPVKSEKSRVPVPATTTSVKKDQLKKPIAPPRAVSKERVKPNEAPSKTSRTIQPSKQDFSTPAKKRIDPKATKPVPARSETATISKPLQNGASKKPSKVTTNVKSRKEPGTVKLSGSKTATKVKANTAVTPETSSASSDKEERPSTVNLSSRKGENRVIRNPDSIIANNEAVLNASSVEAAVDKSLDQDSLDAEIDYEDDFEDYESDFEPDDEDDDDAYNDDDESEISESYHSEVSFSEASDISNPDKKVNASTDKVEDHTESIQSSTANATKELLHEANTKPSTLSLYESKNISDSTLATPMTPITVTPMTPTAPLITPVTPSASLFNFAQAEHSIIQKKSKSRASELLELITLDKQTFNIYESPPAKYEMFIQIFGRSNRKQVLVQTEGSEEQTTQTDEIDTLEKWTQNPAHGLREVGGDLMSEELENWKMKVNGVKLSNFITNSSCLVLKILDEETTEVIQNRLTKSDITVPFSSGYFELDSLEISADQSVNEVCFSEGQPTYLLSVHSTVPSNTASSSQTNSIISIWDPKNPAQPEYVLAPMSVVSKCCFNPGNPTIVFAGMTDGSIALWDLREQHFQHKELPLNNSNTVTYRSPTYSTAAFQWEVGHHSAVVDLQTFVYQNSSSSKRSQSGFMYENQFCNLLSLEDLGILNIWTVLGVSKSDPSGSDTDLGLAPRGNLKLLKTSSILISGMLPSASMLAAGLRSFCFRIEPSNPHNLFIATDAGIVMHCTRQGHLAMPRIYKADAVKEIRCLVFSPHRLPHFAVGSNDGTVYIYNTKSTKPLLKCLYGPHCVVSIQWSVIRPTVFYVLDSNSCIQVWDLAVSKTAPIYISDFQSEGIGCFSVVADRVSNSQWSQYLVICLLTGAIRVFKLVDNLVSTTEDEYDLLRNTMNDL